MIETNGRGRDRKAENSGNHGATGRHFGHELRNFRKSTGMSQAGLASKIGVDKGQPSTWENRATPPRGWEKFERALETSWPHLMDKVPRLEHYVTPTSREAHVQTTLLSSQPASTRNATKLLGMGNGNLGTGNGS